MNLQPELAFIDDRTPDETLADTASFLVAHDRYLTLIDALWEVDRRLDPDHYAELLAEYDALKDLWDFED